MNDTRYSGKGYNVCVGVCVWVREREKKKKSLLSVVYPICTCAKTL